MNYDSFTAAQLSTIRDTKAYRGEVFSNLIGREITRAEKASGKLLVWVLVVSSLLLALAAILPPSWGKVTLLVILGVFDAVMIFALGGDMAVAGELGRIREQDILLGEQEDSKVMTAIHRAALREEGQREIERIRNYEPPYVPYPASDTNPFTNIDTIMEILSTPPLIYPERSPANRPLILD